MGKRILKLITRFVGNKCVVFDGSRVYYWNIPMIILPLDALSFLQKELELRFGKKARDTIFYLGKLQGLNGSNILIQKFNFIPDVKDMSFFLEQTEFVGVGKLSTVLDDLKNSHMVFSVVSPNAKSYIANFGKINHPICDYVRGLYAGGIEAIANVAVKNDESLIAIETKCVAKGDDVCIIEIRKSSKWKKSEVNHDYPLDIPAIAEARKLETLAKLVRVYAKPFKDPDTLLNSFLKSKNLKRPFTFGEEGNIDLIGADSLITPIDIIVLLYHIFENKAKDIFYDTGIFLGKSSTARLVSKYSLDTGRADIQRMLFDQIGLFGLGKIELVRSNTEKYEYTFYLYNSPGDHYKDLLGTSKNIKADYLVAGILSGILEGIYQKKFETIEQNCVVSGSTYCIFSSKKIGK